MNPQRQNLVQHICEAIEDGSIVRGQQLFTERELSEYFNEKRGSIREALIALDALDVIEIRERQGIFLKTNSRFNNLKNLSFLPPVKVLNQVFEFRLMLETSAAESAALRRTDEHIEQLQQEIRFFEEIIRSKDPSKDKLSFQHNTILHRLIMDATGNQVNIEVFKSVSKLSESCFEVLGNDKLNFRPYKLWGETLLEEHRAVVNAVIEGDSERARDAMRKHLEESRNRNNKILQDGIYSVCYPVLS